MKLLSTVAAVLMLSGTVAMAADLDVKPRHRAAPPPQTYEDITPQQYPQYPQIPQQYAAQQSICPFQTGAPVAPPPCFGGCPPQYASAGFFGGPGLFGGFPFLGARLGIGGRHWR